MEHIPERDGTETGTTVVDQHSCRRARQFGGQPSVEDFDLLG